MSLGMAIEGDTPDEHGSYCQSCERTHMDEGASECPFCGESYDAPEPTFERPETIFNDYLSPATEKGTLFLDALDDKCKEIVELAKDMDVDFIEAAYTAGNVLSCCFSEAILRRAVEVRKAKR